MCLPNIWRGEGLCRSDQSKSIILSLSARRNPMFTSDARLHHFRLKDTYYVRIVHTSTKWTQYDLWGAVEDGEETRNTTIQSDDNRRNALPRRNPNKKESERRVFNYINFTTFVLHVHNEHTTPCLYLNNRQETIQQHSTLLPYTVVVTLSSPSNNKPSTCFFIAIVLSYVSNSIYYIVVKTEDKKHLKKSPCCSTIIKRGISSR